MSTYADTLNGNYLFPGLDEDSYNLKFMPDTATQYADTSIENIMVNTGFVTVVDTVKFKEKP